MITNYEREQIETYLDKQINEAEICIRLWSAVSFPTKKDGSAFKVMSKNIEGANYKPWQFSDSDHEYKLSVYGNSYGIFASDEINLWINTRYLKDDKKLAKKENQYPDGIYSYDLDDIKEAVAERIEYWQGRLADLKKEREVCDTAFNTFLRKCSDAVNELIDITGSDCNDLYYRVIETIGNNIKYINR